MFGRIENAWGLAKTSAGVLRQDKELLAFPVIGGVIAVVIMLVGFALAWVVGMDTDANGDTQFTTAAALVLLVAGALATFATIYYRAALVAGAGQRFKGGDPTLASSRRAVRGHLAAIAAFTGISLLVRAISNAVREEGGLLGNLFGALIDGAYAAASFLTLPVILEENTTGWGGLKRSTSLLKRTWGENLSAQFGLGIIGGLVAIGGVLVAALLGALVSPLGAPAVVAVAVLGVIWVLGVVTVFSALTGVFQMALYLYAMETEGGETVHAELPFGDQQMRQAFGQR